MTVSGAPIDQAQDDGYELVVAAEHCAIESDPDDGHGVRRRRLVEARAGSALHLDVLEIDAGVQVTFGPEPGGHELAYLLSGEVELTRGSERVTIGADTAFFHDSAVSATAQAKTPARIAVFGAGAGCDEHVLLGDRILSAPLDLGSAEAATGRRSFQVLLGPESGCSRATMFVGVVPPGAAPWHFHQYDEIVYLLDGTARYHQAGGAQLMSAGSAVRIPSRTVHINENTTAGEMRVLGVFTPAGSPSAAYLAETPRAD